MEVQQNSDKLGQSSYRLNLLDAMAKSSIKYLKHHVDATKSEALSMPAQDHQRSISCRMTKMPSSPSISYISRLLVAE